MRQIISVNDLSETEIGDLCRQAAQGIFPQSHSQSQYAVGLLFLEASTRTRTSFERAAHRLGLRTILIESKGSSMEKNESLEDTLLNLQALDVNPFVIRTPHTGSLESLRSLHNISLINGGDGTGEHPSQALLDLTTLVQQRGGDFGRLRGLKLGILGDLKHSRVARSWSLLAPRFGIELSLLSPRDWRADWTQNFVWSSRKKDILPSLDVLMCLRVQKERMTALEPVDFEGFTREFQIHPRDLSPHQKVLHPGPVNWGIELSREFHRDDPRLLILAQVKNGLAVRAGLLNLLRQDI